MVGAFEATGFLSGHVKTRLEWAVFADSRRFRKGDLAAQNYKNGWETTTLVAELPRKKEPRPEKRYRLRRLAERAPGTSQEPAKVRAAAAEILSMAHEQPQYPDNRPIWAEARALEASIRAIRRAQGKKNPEDFPAGSAECTAAMDEFVRDVCRALEIDISALDGRDDEQ